MKVTETVSSPGAIAVKLDAIFTAVQPQIVPFGIFLTALVIAAVLGRWLGQMPRERLGPVLSGFAAVGVITLIGLAIVIMPSQPH